MLKREILLFGEQIEMLKAYRKGEVEFYGEESEIQRRIAEGELV